MNAELPELVLPIDRRDHVLGPLSARYTLVEYGEYDSVHCRNVVATCRELVRELEDDLCFAFRNYPQPKLHPRSQAAALAAEAAGLQGKFWLMHDRLFDHQDELNDQEIRRLALALPVDAADYDRDLASGAAARRVADDVELADEDGVGDTPTMFVNGREHVGQYEFLPLLSALKETGRK